MRKLFEQDGVMHTDRVKQSLASGTMIMHPSKQVVKPGAGINAGNATVVLKGAAKPKDTRWDRLMTHPIHPGIPYESIPP
jgi:hypothetical protein